MNRMRIAKALAIAALLGGVAWTSNMPVAARAAEQGKGSKALPPSFQPRAERCAVKPTDPLTLDLIDQQTATTKDDGAVITTPVYWHVITTASGGGNVSSRIPSQMTVLRDAYAGSRIAFELKSIEVVANDSWFYAAAESAEELAMKASLRKGGPEALNIYTTNGDIYLGWATPAFNYKFAPSYDGVVVYWATLPGTGFEFPVSDEPDGMITYDRGDTATHEVGHWFGLLHTFGPGNGCTKPGDKITDTPTEAEPQFLCIARDSCVGANNPGDDPITNFMDYVDDVCMDNFTADQTHRMRTHFHAYRDKKARQ